MGEEVSKWQEVMVHSLRTPQQFEEFFHCSFPKVPYASSLPLRMAKKIQAQGLDGPLGKQFLPREEEGRAEGFKDPIGDGLRRLERGVIHRYQNRILLSPTPVCPVHCRYCFRKNTLKENPEQHRYSPNSLRELLKTTPQVNEVIFSGGDPLVINDGGLEDYLNILSGFPQVKFFRLHSRTPLMVPERMTGQLVELFSRFQRATSIQVHLVIHLNHWSEVDDDILQALSSWQEAGLSIMAQSVLLKGVNDCVESLYELFLNLALSGIRPYYLHHPDRVRGAMHFYLPLERGRALYGPLRLKLPGWALPHYVLDSPGGEGKQIVGF